MLVENKLLNLNNSISRKEHLEPYSGITRNKSDPIPQTKLIPNIFRINGS